MASSALSPVSEAVLGVLLDASLRTVTPGGWHDSALPPNHQDFPCGVFDVNERDIRGFGAGELPEVELRTHVYSLYGGMKEAQEINRQAIALLKDQALTIPGYRQAGTVIFVRTLPPFDEIINDVQCQELVSEFRMYAEI